MTQVKHTRTAKVLSVLLAAAILFVSTLAPEAYAATTATKYENAVLYWTNIERSRAGLKKFKTSSSIIRAARTRASEIQTSYSHTRPNGSRWTSALTARGIDYVSAGENFGYGYTSPCSVVKAWMDSETHRTNIMKSKFTCMGVGCVYNSDTKDYYWTQLFTGGATYSEVTGAYYVAPKGVNVNKTKVKLSVGKTTTVTGTPSPNYATKLVTCTSSDKSVVKVTGTCVNVFTIKGVADGTAKLTISCGSYSKTVTVTVGTGVKAS